MKIKFFLAWYDIWMGLYISRKDRKLYICPLPCCVIMISLPKKNTYLTVTDISMFRKGEEIQIVSAVHPEDKGTVHQIFKVLKIYPKTNKIKVKEIKRMMGIDPSGKK